MRQYWSHHLREWETSVYGHAPSALSFRERLATHFRAHLRERQRFALRRLGPCVRGKVVVEIGCGSGGLLLSLVQAGASKGYGFDIAPEAIALARTEARLRRVADRAHFVCTGASEALLPAEPVDWLVGFGIVEYLSCAALSAVLTKLSPARIFLSFDERVLTPHKAMHFVYRKWAGIPFYRQYRQDEIRCLAETLGYRAKCLREGRNAFVEGWRR